MITSKKVIRRTAAYLALATVLLFIITGYGITQFRIVEKLSLGLLGKALAFKIHSWLIIPLIIFLLIHISLSFSKSRFLGNGQEKENEKGKQKENGA